MSEKKKGLLTYYGDDIAWNAQKAYTDEAKLLFDIRRYLKVFVALTCVSVTVVVVCFLLLWHKVSTIEIFKTGTLNAYNTRAASIFGKTDTLMSYLVNVGSDVNVTTAALVASFMTGFNSSALVAGGPAAPTRHLLQAGGSSTENFADMAVPTDISSQTLGKQDYMFRKMVYTQVQKLLNTTETKVSTFDFASISNLINWVVYGVNYTEVAFRIDRTLTDVENVGKFGVLSTTMLGIASQLLNVTLPHIGIPSMQTVASAMTLQATAAASAAPDKCTP